MVASECWIETDRASRYLVQLCRHARFMSTMRHPTPGVHRPPRILEASHSDATGLVRFEDGSWLLTADASSLHLRVDAVDSAALARLVAGISARIRTIGRRDGLELTWSAVPTSSPAAARETVQDAAPPRARLTRIALLLGVVAAVVAAHLVVGAVALSGARAVGWVTLAGVLGVGAAALAVHVLIARVALSGARLPGGLRHGGHQRQAPPHAQQPRPPEK